MPDWDPLLIDPAINRKDATSIGWIFPTGRLYSTSLGFIGAGVTPDPGNVSAFRAAVGNMSNAGVIRMTEHRDTFLAKKNAVAYDELHGEGMVVQCYFQNNNGEIADFYVPMPDASLFNDDGVTLDPANALVIAMAAAAETLINNSYDPANSYEFTHGVLRDHRSKLPTGGRIKPTITEPGVGDNPPDAPGV